MAKPTLIFTQVPSCLAFPRTYDGTTETMPGAALTCRHEGRAGGPVLQGPDLSAIAQQGNCAVTLKPGTNHLNQLQVA